MWKCGKENCISVEKKIVYVRIRRLCTVSVDKNIM
jgi:hypothetical protein